MALDRITGGVTVLMHCDMTLGSMEPNCLQCHEAFTYVSPAYVASASEEFQTTVCGMVQSFINKLVIPNHDTWVQTINKALGKRIQPFVGDGPIVPDITGIPLVMKNGTEIAIPWRGNMVPPPAPKPAPRKRAPSKAASSTTAPSTKAPSTKAPSTKTTSSRGKARTKASARWTFDDNDGSMPLYRSGK